MELFDPRLMKLLTYLTRRQAWLAPIEISKDFRLDGGRVTSRTIHRWFSFLREHGGFVYYPYPRANALGLQDVLVQVRGLRNPETLAVLPFGCSFNVEVGLADGVPFISQGYWVPGGAVEAFRDYWVAARDLGLVERVEIFQSRNTHYIFSPFHEVTTPEGVARVETGVDNGYFERLLKRHMREPFEVRLADAFAKAPLVIPVVVEHIWAHYSSRHVWEAIREKGEEAIAPYAKGKFGRLLERPAAAVRYLQDQWKSLLVRFDDVFLQPRVFFDWTSLQDATFVSFAVKAGSPDRMVEAAVRASERSIVTSFRPGVGYEERCHVSCFAPRGQLLPILEVVRGFHADREPPVVALQDRDATLEMFQPSFCRVDWRLFDPATLSWQFHGDEYVERLKGLTARAGDPPFKRATDTK